MKKILATLMLLAIVTAAWTIPSRFTPSIGYASNSDTVSTTDGTQTPVVYLNIPQNTSAHVRVRVVGRSTTATKAWDIDIAARRGTGAITIISTTNVSLLADAAAILWDASVDSVSDNLRLQVTGAALTSINWAGNLDAFMISD